MNLTPIEHLELVLPIKTISEANRPWGEHWRFTRARKIAQQEEVTVELTQALRGKFIRMPCQVTLTRMSCKALDTDNLASAFKGIRDAIAKALGADDGVNSSISWSYKQSHIRKRQYFIKINIDSKLTVLVLEE